jgi:2'-5' RNA ligase
MRLFVGLPLGDSVKARLGSIQDRYLNLPRIRRESLDKLHMTLLYIGEVANFTPYAEAMKTVAFERFSITIDRVGVFNNCQTVYHAGIVPNETMFKLAQKILLAIQMVNPELKYRFLPHVTLARGHVQVPLEFIGPPVTEMVEKVILYESKEGRYIPRAEFPLI